MEELRLHIDFTRSDGLQTPAHRRAFVADAMRILGDFSRGHHVTISIDPPCEIEQSRVNSAKANQWAFEEEE